LKTFIANITVQVIERHIVGGIEKIFSPVLINQLSATEVEGFASEPIASKRMRELYKERIKKLKNGQSILRQVIRRGTN